MPCNLFRPRRRRLAGEESEQIELLNIRKETHEEYAPVVRAGCVKRC